MNSEQIVYAMYWVREIFLGLMKRTRVVTKVEKQQAADDEEEIIEEEETK